jgi:ribose-phosphate pyrophosphokinase
MISITATGLTSRDPESTTKTRRPVEIKYLKFPGGEMHVTVQTDVPASELEVKAHLPHADAVMTLLLATDALRRAYPGIPIDLHVPYVPYARQDRVANPGEALSARVFCELINSQRYRRVVVQDPHSDVVTALLDRVVVEDPVPSLRRVVDMIREHWTQVTLVAPDAGARKRVQKLAEALALPVIFADKLRDTKTGAITGTQVQGEMPAGALLVVDDICDGGRTFTELGRALRAQQLRTSAQFPLYLFVTHGIFSKGLDALLENYCTVFTRNSWTADSRAVQI